jgi:predicted membrane channel-forming protein YqfA (hemolysin III family)
MAQPDTWAVVAYFVLVALGIAVHMVDQKCKRRKLRIGLFIAIGTATLATIVYSIIASPLPCLPWLELLKDAAGLTIHFIFSTSPWTLLGQVLILLTFKLNATMAGMRPW